MVYLVDEVLKYNRNIESGSIYSGIGVLAYLPKSMCAKIFMAGGDIFTLVWICLMAKDEERVHS